MCKKFKEWREYHNLTLEQAGEIIGMDASYLSLLENGKRMPKLETAVEIEKKTYGKVKCEDWVSNNQPEK